MTDSNDTNWTWKIFSIEFELIERKTQNINSLLCEIKSHLIRMLCVCDAAADDDDNDERR